MMRPRSKWMVVVVTCALAAGVLVSGWGIFETRTVVLRALPKSPEPVSISPPLAGAIAHAERAARGYFKSRDGLVQLSQLYHANGFSAEAQACYEGLRQLEPEEARWPHLQSGIVAGFGDLQAAEPLQRQAVALRPDYLPAALRLGEIELKANKPAAAAATYARVLTQESGNRYAQLGLAKCAMAAGDWETARGFLRKVLETTPDFQAALTLLIAVEERSGNLAAARGLTATLGKREVADFPDPWLDELAEHCFDAYRLSVIAATSLAAGDATTARRWLERAISLEPKAGTYRRQLGKLFFQAADLALAREQVERAVTLTPEDSDAWILLADIFTAQRDPAAAERTLAAGVRSNPQSPGLHYAIGHRLTEAGRFGEAVRELKMAQTLRPNEVNAGIDLAMIHFQADQIEQGLAELKAVLAIQPGHPLAMEILTRQAIASNDEPAARKWFRELQLQPRVAPEDLLTIAREFRQQFGREVK